MTFISRVKAIGRPVLEASFFNVPSIVFLNEKKSDYIIDNSTGYIIKEDNLNEVVEKLYIYIKKEVCYQSLVATPTKIVQKSLILSIIFQYLKKRS